MVTRNRTCQTVHTSTEEAATQTDFPTSIRENCLIIRDAEARLQHVLAEAWNYGESSITASDVAAMQFLGRRLLSLADDNWITPSQRPSKYLFYVINTCSAMHPCSDVDKQ